MEPITHRHLEDCKQNITNRFTHILDEHIKDEEIRYKNIESQLTKVSYNIELLMRLFEQSRGALTVIKYLALGVAGLWALILWANDHIKL